VGNDDRDRGDDVVVLGGSQKIARLNSNFLPSSLIRARAGPRGSTPGGESPGPLTR
jgi:hypothetical protein